LVLLYLVNDLVPEAIVIPQFQFDTFNDKPVAPDDSIIPTAQADAKALTPDFSIAIFHLVGCPIPVSLPSPPVVFPAKFSSWWDIRVNNMQIPLIAELKRPPSHHARTLPDFQQDLTTLMDAVCDDLLRQVEHAFIMQPEARKVVLLAGCREWWVWTVATRTKHLQDFILLVSVDADENKLEEEAPPDVIPKSSWMQPHRTTKKLEMEYIVMNLHLPLMNLTRFHINPKTEPPGLRTKKRRM
jgi:hypothetical protein